MLYEYNQCLRNANPTLLHRAGPETRVDQQILHVVTRKLSLNCAHQYRVLKTAAFLLVSAAWKSVLN